MGVEGLEGAAVCVAGPFQRMGAMNSTCEAGAGGAGDFHVAVDDYAGAVRQLLQIK